MFGSLWSRKTDSAPCLRLSRVIWACSDQTPRQLSCGLDQLIPRSAWPGSESLSLVVHSVLCQLLIQFPWFSSPTRSTYLFLKQWSTFFELIQTQFLVYLLVNDSLDLLLAFLYTFFLFQVFFLEDIQIADCTDWVLFFPIWHNKN